MELWSINEGEIVQNSTGHGNARQNCASFINHTF